jgi:hypothetical protein
MCSHARELLHYIWHHLPDVLLPVYPLHCTTATWNIMFAALKACMWHMYSCIHINTIGTCSKCYFKSSTSAICALPYKSISYKDVTLWWHACTTVAVSAAIAGVVQKLLLTIASLRVLSTCVTGCTTMWTEHACDTATMAAAAAVAAVHRSSQTVYTTCVSQRSTTLSYVVYMCVTLHLYELHRSVYMNDFPLHIV